MLMLSFQNYFRPAVLTSTMNFLLEINFKGFYFNILKLLVFNNEFP
jgi:hypothetical protein